jgi:hypothetical protein
MSLMQIKGGRLVYNAEKFVKKAGVRKHYVPSAERTRNLTMQHARAILSLAYSRARGPRVKVPMLPDSPGEIGDIASGLQARMKMAPMSKKRGARPYVGKLKNP